MRIVVDTNVLVSALLSPGRTPDLALSAASRAGVVVLVDDRIEAEYRSVLARPKLTAIDPATRDARIASLLVQAERVEAAPLERALIDPDDRVFVEVALSGRADLLVTGNLKHFPPDLGVEVVAPRALLERLEASTG